MVTRRIRSGERSRIGEGFLGGVGGIEDVGDDVDEIGASKDRTAVTLESPNDIPTANVGIK